MSGSAPEQVCTFCGDNVGRQWLINALGEVFCVSHESAPRCRTCGSPAAASGSERYCPGCAATRVLDQGRVREVLPAIRDGLHGLGIRLSTPVQVELVSRDVMRDLAGPWDTSGLTISSGDRVLRLTVVAGLPLMWFGAAVCHEAMHAWLAQHRFPDNLASPLCEGLCQLTAFSWLRRQDDPRAALVRQSMETDPDPDYGAGFRTVRDAVARHGLTTVLSTMRHHGRLP
ncbi:protein DA1 [Luedemannella helvata]|uniref:Protein DA1-like domain-containing protein n=1 Tax=Luedemannella helvata TaxID=349315 RepID=A0ABP4W031_9ACTN